MGIIRLNNIQVFAHHGCLPQEAIIGGNYVVDVAVHLDFTAAAREDDLSQTADYVVISKIVHDEMAVRSKLIETVLRRILESLKKQFPDSEKIWARVTKMSAPIPGQVESVSVEHEI